MFPRGRTLYNRMFRRPTGPKNKAGVKKIGFTSKNMINNGTVAPQDKNESTKNVRMRTYEQNFLRRIFTYVDNSFIKTDPSKTINFGEFTLKLTDKNLTEEEAIIIYNELIALFMILSLYVLAIHNWRTTPGYTEGHVGKRKVGTISKLKLDDKFDIEEFLLDFANNRGNIIRALLKDRIKYPILFASLFGVTAGVAAAGPVIGPALIAALTGVGGISLIVRTISRSTRPLRTDLLGVFKLLYKTMFSEENTIPIVQVKDKLKYWGLTQGQVKLLFEVNLSDESTNGDSNNRFIRFIENFTINMTDDDEPAPNGPLLMPSNEDITPVTAFNTDDEQPPEGGYRKKKNTRKLKKRRSNSL